jgi:cytoskeletal protein CcmA (bactofilin family)
MDLVTKFFPAGRRQAAMRSYDRRFPEEQALASQSPFFGKREREPDNFNSRPAPLVGSGSNLGGTPVHPSTSIPPLSAGSLPQAAPAGAAPASAPAKEGGSKLIVGPNIKLKGVEITDCDTLVVEGLVEATMDSRVIQIAEQGEFKGSAHIDIAEIRGVFDGNLIVRDRLVIHSTGRVTGKIRYGKIVIEEGGQLSGEIAFGTSDARKPSLQAA